MLKVLGRATSGNVQKVLWLLEELGQPYVREDYGRQFNNTSTPEYLGMNPSGKVPTLVDGDTVVWESNTILRYVCNRYAPASTLYPADPAGRTQVERWMDWQQTTFNSAGSKAFWQWIRTPADKRDMQVIAQSVAVTEPLLHLLDAQLQHRAYIAGDTFTMADIPLGCEIHRWFGLPQPRPALPHLERWYATLLARPAARGVLDLTLS